MNQNHCGAIRGPWMLTGVSAPAPELLARAPAGGAAAMRVPSGLGGRWLALLQALERRHEAARTRRHLARLDDRLLRDIGLSRADVGPELPAPFPGLGEPLTRDRTVGRGPGARPARYGLWHL
jgi:uncharacterized protein YjiS (DUF1127 family)